VRHIPDGNHVSHRLMLRQRSRPLAFNIFARTHALPAEVCVPLLNCKRLQSRVTSRARAELQDDGTRADVRHFNADVEAERRRRHALNCDRRLRESAPRGTCQKTQNESVAHAVLDTIALAVRTYGLSQNKPLRALSRKAGS
jgi:hypothetical protein